MIRLLPFILIPVLILGALGYWRYVSQKSVLTAPQTSQQDGPVEVPKTLPTSNSDSSIIPTPTPKTQSSPVSSAASDTRLNALDAQVTELKARVSALEKTTTTTTNTNTNSSSSKTTIYIPLGSGGNWSNIEWTTFPEYEISLNPSNFPGYSSMSLEVTFRVDDPSGTASIRLYNVSDNYAISSQLDTASSTFVLQSTSSFTLASGTKTYRIQAKTSGGKALFIQTARIKVTF